MKEKVDPVLAEHYGGATLTGFENNVAKVRLTGACASCPSAQYTIEDVVKNIVMENCEGVKDVILDTSVSEDLLDMAKKILRK
nr:NifU family protein [Anaerovorax odorimutans]